MTERSYPTRLTNNTTRPLMVHELDSELVEIQPGESFEVESRSNATLYARWSEVTWHEGGKVTFVTRSNFTEPERGRWLIRLFNQDGQAVEKRMIGGRLINLPKGVPVLIGLKLDDPLVQFKSMTIIKKRVMLKDPEHEGYIIHETITKGETVLRDASELKALEKLVTEKDHEG